MNVKWNDADSSRTLADLPSDQLVKLGKAIDELIRHHPHAAERVPYLAEYAGYVKSAAGIKSGKLEGTWDQNFRECREATADALTRRLLEVDE